jgi:hypothetical protein
MGKGLEDHVIQPGLEARCWWLMPVILATQEAEIRKIVVLASPGK